MQPKIFLPATKIYKLYVPINYLYSFIEKLKDVMPYVNQYIEQNFQNERFHFNYLICTIFCAKCHRLY